MTNPALLKSFRAIRDVVADIHQSATVVDEHLGRFQIYGAGDEIRHALAEAEGLFAMIERLEHELRRCTSIAHRGRSIENRAADSSRDLR